VNWIDKGSYLKSTVCKGEGDGEELLIGTGKSRRRRRWTEGEIGMY
jgi:hypothetical protein